MRTEDVLRDDKRTADAAKQAKTDVLAGQHLLGIINDVLDRARTEDGRLDLADDPFDVNDVVRTCVGLLESSAKGKGLTIDAVVAPDVPPSIRCDRLRLQQIVLNYLANAVTFTDRGGVSLAVTRRNERLHIAVSDTGPGISETKQHLLFQHVSPIEQGRHAVPEGSGLGLAITKRIVDALGGDVGVYSALGVGSTFWVEIPLHAVAPAPCVVPAPDLAAGGARPADRAIHVLLAEDVLVNQMVLRMVLEDEGFDVDVVGDGDAAVAAARTGLYDLVFLDVEMPKLTGLEAARAIRALPGDLGRLPLVALTANAFPDQIAACRAAGMDGCLTKPVERRKLVEAVHRWTHSAREAIVAYGPDSPGLFNVSIFEDLQSRIGVAKLEMLFEIFKRTTREGFEALDRAPPESQAECLHQVTHSLVSTAGTLGFEALSVESRAIMEGHRMAEFDMLVVELKSLADRSMAAWVATSRRPAAAASLSAA